MSDNVCRARQTDDPFLGVANFVRNWKKNVLLFIRIYDYYWPNLFIMKYIY